MTCGTHAAEHAIEIDRITVRGKLFVRYVCELCEGADWWEDEDGNEADPQDENDAADPEEEEVP